MVLTLQKLKTSNLNLDFEFQQLLGSLNHVINITMWIRDTRCYNILVTKSNLRKLDISSICLQVRFFGLIGYIRPSSNISDRGPLF
jgi:hypothetical protein